MSDITIDAPREERTLHVNPSWLIQAMLATIIAVAGYFMDGTLSDIKTELQLSRVERAQLRSDLANVQLGVTGDRFTRTDWIREQDKIQKQIDDARDRIRELENKGK